MVDPTKNFPLASDFFAGGGDAKTKTGNYLPPASSVLVKAFDTLHPTQRNVTAFDLVAARGLEFG